MYKEQFMLVVWSAIMYEKKQSRKVAQLPASGFIYLYVL